ncbi:MAG: protein TolR, partial [Betaproteobacteria bacterium]
VVIRASGTTPYKDVIAVVDLLQSNNVRKVGLLAQPQSN